MIPVLRMEGGQKHSNMSSITFWGRVKDGKKYPKLLWGQEEMTQQHVQEHVRKKGKEVTS